MSFNDRVNSDMITAHAGTPHPLGPSVIHSTSSRISVNLAVFSHKALTLLIFSPPHPSQTLLRHPLIHFPITSRTANIYHIAIHNLPYHASYALHPHRSDRLVHDPYAKFLESRSVHQWMTLPAVSAQISNPFREFRRLLRNIPTFRAMHICHPFILSLFSAPLAVSNFDWCDIPPPNVPHHHSFIYEAHVRALTRAGTFESAVAVIPYLKWLGVTTLQLMPILEFDELETTSGDHIRKPNMWGYSPASLFMPMGRYSACAASIGLKTLVRELHRAGIECVLDVVYNHSAHASCPLHFFGVQRAYYIDRSAGQDFQHSNISGCGNTLSPNSPVMSDMIMESLRWLVSEYHIDGFRIDAAGVLCRDPSGEPIRDPTIMHRIASDPMLKETKIIVEGWDAGDQIGSPNMLLGRFPRGEVVSEWNPWWRDAVRKFWRGDGDDEDFCEALRGCPRLFKSRRPHGAYHSVNFLACHDGFCLADVVSYSKRVNKDGYDEVSFNCGAEGRATEKDVNAIRAQQMRNMILTLAVSRGIPMILQGDELGFSKEGHSNTWNDPDRYACALPEKPYEVPAHDALVQFTRYMFKLRQSYSQFTGMDFHHNVTWVATDGKPVHRGKGRNTRHGVVAFVTAGNELGQKLFVAFNRGTSDINLNLPDENVAWGPLVDTSTTKWRRDSHTSTQTAGKATISPRSSVIYVGRSAR